MIWGSKKLKDYISNGGVTNTYDGCVNPASINLRLGDSWARLPVNDEDGPITITLGDEVAYKNYMANSFVLFPGEFILATTMECVDIPVDVASFVQGRSSIGRIGLSVQNAGFVDPGFKGHITLELKNDGPVPIQLLAGYPVAQLIIMDAEDVEDGYSGKYQNQVRATGSRMHLDKVKVGA